MKFHYPVGATPIDGDELSALIPDTISLQRELNELEQANIAQADLWAFSRKHRHILTIDFVKRLHKKMFVQVWKWAGSFRQTNKNIGADAFSIVTELKKFLDDAEFWLDKQTFNWPEFTARFHHRLVSIHPFPNGNGRHARLMTDIVLFTYDQARPSWSIAPLNLPGETRKQYIKALQQADKGNYLPLIDFIKG